MFTISKGNWKRNSDKSDQTNEVPDKNSVKHTQCRGVERPTTTTTTTTTQGFASRSQRTQHAPIKKKKTEPQARLKAKGEKNAAYPPKKKTFSSHVMTRAND